jgi:hypothetical protein
MKNETLLNWLLGTYAICGAGGLLVGIIGMLLLGVPNRLTDIGFTVSLTGMVAGAVILIIIGMTMIRGE